MIDPPLGDPYRDNVFPRRVLEALASQDDEAPLSTEPDESGPWYVHAMAEGKGWGVFREGDGPAVGDHPAALFQDRARALLFSVALPAAGREPSFGVRDASSSSSREVFSPSTEGLAPIGEIWHLEDRSIEALRVLDAVARSPRLLADLLEAAGSAAILRVGRLLFRRLVLPRL